MISHPKNSPITQKGISLLVVMVMLLLCSLLALGSARVGWLNEALVGNFSDEQRAYWAAEALVQDATNDIRGLGIFPTTNSREYGNSVNFYFPQSLDDVIALQARAGTLSTPCNLGLCYPASLDTINGTNGTYWWQNGQTTISNMRAAGATYGSITGAVAQGNPLLTPSANGLAHYWIEVFNYNTNVKGNYTLAKNIPLDEKRPFIYRVTAAVDGRKPGTRVVLQVLITP